MGHGVTLLFSHLELCDFIDQTQFTINYEFISSLLSYDKIQTGETGLNEVNELRGGEKLTVSSEGGSSKFIWDANKFAAEPLLLPEDEASELLRAATMHVVRSWAECYSSVMVELSGGLDSSIVLGCVAASNIGADLSAVHFMLRSDDPIEVEYARSAARKAHCPLDEIWVDPDNEIPASDTHARTVRPYRQFLGSELSALNDTPQMIDRDACFTGQGGDHIFLATRDVYSLSDYLVLRGMGGNIGREVLNTARLTDTSVWHVLKEGIRGAISDTDAVADIVSRRNILNRSHRSSLLSTNEWA